MSQMRPGDMGAVPLFFLAERDYRQQVVLLWILDAENRGAKWNIKYISGRARLGVAAVSKACTELAAEGALVRREGKTNSPYAVELSCLPDNRVEKVPEKPKNFSGMFEKWQV